ncbi:MAG: methyltransferase domain-containing protein [Candidatus Marinimicrobia bacterium]|nr:methyltransferase domain-containing protein [Candidatus Neomarinimicrobiota bacterium]
MCLNEYQDIIKFFDEKSLHWHFSQRDVRNASKVVDMIQCESPEVILDVGCGTGGLFPFLFRRFPQAKILGMDLSAKMLSLVKFQYDLLFLGNAENLPLLDCSVDIVLNYCVFPHFNDRLKVVREAFRVLKPGGHYYIIHPDGRKKTNEIHQRQKSTVISHLLPQHSEISNFLRNTGFRIFKELDEEMLLYGCEK